MGEHKSAADSRASQGFSTRAIHAGYEPDPLTGAVNVPIHDILRRAAEVPAGEVWVHCAGGYRASVAASILAASGHRVVAVDDSFDRAGEVGLPMAG